MRVSAIIPTKQKLTYKAFGLTVVSEISLPELPPSLEQDVSTGLVEVVLEDLTGIWKEHGLPSGGNAVINGHFYFHTPKVAIFSVQEGSRIAISPEPDADEDIIRLLLLGTCMGAILMQRRVLPLHGSAVVIDGKAYAIVGDKGAGKSTLAAAFLNKGYTLLTDDVIAVSFDGQGEGTLPLVKPAYPQQKLWQESLDHLAMDASRFSNLYQQFPKYSIPVASSFCEETIPLAGIFELSKADIESPELQLVTGLERFPLLHYHTYRNYAIPLLGLEQWHFQTTAQLLQSIGVYRLRRPVAGFTAHELAAQILHTVNKGE